MPLDTSRTGDELIGYEEAARILGVRPNTVTMIVHRGHLHSVPHPTDRRRRLLVRGEVEARARLAAANPRGIKTPRQAAPTPAPALPALADVLATLPVPEYRAPSDILGTTPDAVIMGAAGLAVLLALLLLATGGGAGAIYRGLMFAGIGALGLAMIAELYAQGRISDMERRQLEALARQAETEGDAQPFIAELQRLMTGPAA